MQHILILADGTVLSSGPEADPAIEQVTLTQKVNTQTDIAFGAVCSTMLEATLWATGQVPGLQAGARVTLCDKDTGTVVGQFILEKPQRTGNVCKLTAYDPISCLDRDFTKFVAGLQGWPYSLLDFVKMVLEESGLELANDQIPNGELSIGKFTASQLTGRQLVAWAAEAAGCFCRANPQGKVEFAWYAQSSLQVNCQGEIFYYTGSLSCADYAVSPITAVQIRAEQTDVGTVYPPDATGENIYIIQGNPYLTATGSEALLPVAQTLYERLRQVSYTPCQLTVPSALDICPGQIFTVVSAGKALTAYAMERKRTRGKDTIYCTGSANRGATRARNQTDYKALGGKVLRLQTDVDGIRAENADMAGNMARMELDLQGIRTQVQSQQEGSDGIRQQLTKLELDSRSAKLQIESILEDGVSQVVTATGYTFTQDGLSIQKNGQEMENLLDHTGMYVRRSGQVILQANNQGVAARDVTVANYLVIGDNARFEDYSNGTDGKRTACFYIGGTYGAKR